MYLINRIPSTVFGGQIPNVVLFPRCPLHCLPTWVFGCTCYIHSSDLGRDKLDNRSIWCVCLGYSRTKKVSKCCSLSVCRHFVCAYVTFNESLPFFSGTLPSVDLPEAESEFVFLVTAPFIPLVKLLQVYFCPSQVSLAPQVLATTPPTSEVPAFDLPIALGTGQGGNPAQSPYGGQMPDPKMDLEKQTNKEHRLSAHEQDMEIGYEDKPSTPSFEGLEQRFLDEIMKLAKEQSDAEDAENARHRERIIEINVQYQEKLSSLRAQQAKRREEFLLKEAQARIHQYKQAASNHYPANASPIDPRGHGMKNASPIDPRGYGMKSASSIDLHGPVDPLGYGPNNARPIDPRGYGSINASPIDPRGYGRTNAVPMDPHGYGGAVAAEAHRAYATGQFESSRDRSPFVGGGRNQVPEARVPIPEGRVYNNTSSRNH